MVHPHEQGSWAEVPLLSFSKPLAFLTSSNLGKHISKDFGPKETSLQDFVRSSPAAIMTPTDFFMKFGHYTLYLVLCETQEQDA